MTQSLTRVESRIPGLDTVLCGGLIRGASYIVQGSPGAGKTILANQLAFAQAGRGERVLYVTLLAESHDRLFQSLSTFDFFDADCVGRDIVYISLFQVLKQDGLSALVLALRKELARQRCTTLVLDGLLIAKDKAESALDVKTFVAELQSHAAFTGCTVLFLTSARVDDGSPEHTMVDGVIQLKEELVGIRTVRRLRVSKSRGSPGLGGLHQYEISSSGVRVYPRLEAVHGRPSKAEPVADARVHSCVAGFDALIQDGLPPASVTLLMGPPGSGKTTFGLSFLAGATKEEPGLWFGFYESAERLIAKANALALPIASLVASDAVSVIWNPLTENLLDGLGHQLLAAVRARKVRRVVIDGLAGFERAAVHPARMVEFYAALTNELRALGVVTIATFEMHNLLAAHRGEPLPEFTSLMDNLVQLRHAEQGEIPDRIITVLKIRDSTFDHGSFEAAIGPGGMTVGARRTLPTDDRSPAPGAPGRRAVTPERT